MDNTIPPLGKIYSNKHTQITDTQNTLLDWDKAQVCGCVQFMKYTYSWEKQKNCLISRYERVGGGARQGMNF